MSHPPLAPNSEKSATSPPGGGTSSAPARKVRSCFVCRQRKVRCDKQSPCGNCRRANIPCVLPSADRPPRWARRRELLANNNAAALGSVATQSLDSSDASLMERVRQLESLVRKLTEQLQQARGSQGSSAVPSPGSSAQNHDEHQDIRYPSADTDVHKLLGRMVLQDTGSTRYVSSGFWSRINDELEGLDTNANEFPNSESNSSEDEGQQMPARGQDSNEAKHSFLFGLNSSPPTIDLHEVHPLPSQVPFLIEVFSENVYGFMSIVHLPSVKKLVHGMRNSGTGFLTPSNEALLFSMYYAAIVSMEEDETMTNFGESKYGLSQRYRYGLENALAKADFLDSPDLTLLQALAIFLSVARRHGSPRYVWMMTGLVIRMAHYLGLHRDGANFNHLTPFEVEMRRRVWWAVILLDVRASEDQGTEITIKRKSFDTRLPLNINDTDIDPESKHTPTERSGATDMSFLRATSGVADITMQMAAANIGNSMAGMEEQGRLVNQVYEKFDQEYLQHVPESGNIAYWMSVTVARVVMAKLSLLAYLPILFSSQSEQASEDIRAKLFISAIEIAEHNDTLNANQACRKWRWIWESYTHWYAIVFLLIEVSRRPWSPTVERAWIALHSEWLFPRQSSVQKDTRMWLPLRKLMRNARLHRTDELNRLRGDPGVASWLALEDREYPSPSSSGLYPGTSSVQTFREQWRLLVMSVEGSLADPSMVNTNIEDVQTLPTTSNLTEASVEQPPGASYNNLTSATSDYASAHNTWPGFASWLWTDTNPSIDVFPSVNMDLDFIDPSFNLDDDMNWYEWIESAKAME